MSFEKKNWDAAILAQRIDFSIKNKKWDSDSSTFNY